ncbi:uncharacterized protein LOC127802428 [Diospyros lotus]|uniref:uncharacterized protein LOC127802428 n=1 Tax=Diospyros lotus TaxID=55363 RepID=UPI00224DE053|nr:uncharacterized protein LOC127802428 [Diospyros lotus]
MTEPPRLLTHIGVFFSPEGSGIASQSKDGGVSSDQLATIKEMEAMIVDSSTVYSGSSMVESKAIGIYSCLQLQKQDGYRGLFVNRGVGSPRLVNSGSVTAFDINLKLDSKTKNVVAATTIANQVLGPKEDTNINILSDGETAGSYGISLYSKQLQKNASPGKKNLWMNSEVVEESKSRKLMRGEGPVIRSTRSEKRSRWNVQHPQSNSNNTMEAEGNKYGDGWTHSNEDRAKRGRNVFAYVPLAEKFKQFKKTSSKNCTNKKYKATTDKYRKHKIFEGKLTLSLG